MVVSLFERDLHEVKGTESCILIVGVEMAAIQSLASLRGDSHPSLLNEAFRSPEQVLTKIQPIFEHTPKLFDVESKGEKEEEEVPSRWKRQVTRGSNISLASGPNQETIAGNNDNVVHTRADSNEERKRKGKGNFIKYVVKEGKQQYGTRSATQKVLGSAMLANAVQTQKRRHQRIRGVV